MFFNTTEYVDVSHHFASIRLFTHGRDFGHIPRVLRNGFRENRIRPEETSEAIILA